jgi:hypothetical protein
VCGDCGSDSDGDAGVDRVRGQGGVLDVFKAEADRDDDAGRQSSQQIDHQAGWDAFVAVLMTYSRRTENAKTTMAFSLNLMRSDHTSNSEMPKMNTSSATAVSSTPFHRRHCRGSDMSKSRMKLHHLPCQYTADHSAHSKALAACTGKRSQERILTLR